MKANGVTHHAGKGSQQEILPSRTALSQLVRTQQQGGSISNYAKAAPDVVQSGPNINDMGSKA